MKKTLAALRRREQRRTRDPLPERLLKYLRRQPQTLCEAGMRSCDQRVVDRLQARCQRDEKRLPQALGPRVGRQP